MTATRPRVLRQAGLASAALAIVVGTGAWAAAPLFRGRAAVPAGWLAAGNRPQDYEMTVDTAVRRAGKPTARLTSTAEAPTGFGTLMQTIAADMYRGRRIRLSGDLRVRDVGGWAALWMRVDGQCGVVLAFDNAQERAARGTADWQPTAVVLDVSSTAQSVSFGALLAGAGTVWISALQFEAVPTTVPVTGRPVPAGRGCGRAGPVNLDFTANAP